MTSTLIGRENYTDMTDPRDQLDAFCGVAVGCEDFVSGLSVNPEDIPVDVSSDCVPNGLDQKATTVILANAGVEVAHEKAVLTKPNTHLDSLV